MSEGPQNTEPFAPLSLLANPEVQHLRAIVTSDLIGDVTFASWLVSNDAELGGRRPIDVLDTEPDAVEVAARHWAAALRSRM
jgi:hypothetical protein